MDTLIFMEILGLVAIVAGLLLYTLPAYAPLVFKPRADNAGGMFVAEVYLEWEHRTSVAPYCQYRQRFSSRAAASFHAMVHALVLSHLFCKHAESNDREGRPCYYKPYRPITFGVRSITEAEQAEFARVWQVTAPGCNRKSDAANRYQPI